MKSRQPITVRVHYPETTEGMEMLKNSQAEVMIDILEKQLGEKKVRELVEYMKIKTEKA
ncbi:hypothetical protein B0P06_004842 [Clostridium saccharoperbutylacetonicum]|uniref:Uncharacterized protein n=1 Tax=Clostridium saccharoperbutylacetonicum N1-4(HMT) TaxID=931276 RepID=M1MQ62_9CLOT|nr:MULTISPECIES: hypothetical protein [Clostridium]AGF56876.1 hypothetical protein Cspa_c31150 [Clostridium saccharoperbutylacetonicum N1-4(HMT)]NRT62365.1 hypothetical protein [Clostridium saccharoperbutylacetonicum]NSB25702.1 hypothetical protein [Clostridium saccharoperbutylacetonicum]NSB45071.1 hypothetical protein [Clostridium saccharoperbutylacetonicum]